MNNLGLLMKINILNTIKYNELKNGYKKEQNKAIGMTLLIAISILVLGDYGFWFCFYFVFHGRSLLQFDRDLIQHPDPVGGIGLRNDDSARRVLFAQRLTVDSEGKYDIVLRDVIILQ